MSVHVIKAFNKIRLFLYNHCQIYLTFPNLLQQDIVEMVSLAAEESSVTNDLFAQEIECSPVELVNICIVLGMFLKTSFLNIFNTLFI